MPPDAFSPLFRARLQNISGTGAPPYFSFMNELRLEVPRINPVPFIAADLVLVGAAALIGWFAPAPISPLSLVALCVAAGAVALLYPFVVNHARRQEEALQDRANQIEALARTVSAAAEQIGIAVSNLPAIAEHSARQLKAAELLPVALKEQLAGLQQQLSATATEENAALRHELDTLRAAETDKLAAALDGLGRATADLARLEKLAAQHSAALDQAIAHLPKIADSFGKQASEALHRETAAAVEALNAAAAEAGQALAAATSEARVAFDRGVRDAVTHLATQATSTPPFPAHVLYRPVITAPGPVPGETKPAALDPEASPAGEPASAAAAPLASAPAPAAATSEKPAPAPSAPEAPADNAASVPPFENALIDDSALDEPEAVPARPAPAPEPVAEESAATPSSPEPVSADPEPEETAPAPSPELALDLEPSAPAPVQAAEVQTDAEPETAEP